MSNDYREYVKSLSLVEALWWFIENVNDVAPHQTDMFFDLRERYRGESQPTPTLISSVKSLISDIEAMQYQHQDWFGPFRETAENEDLLGDTSISVEWPNLRISLDAVQEELNKLPAREFAGTVVTDIVDGQVTTIIGKLDG